MNHDKRSPGITFTRNLYNGNKSFVTDKGDRYGSVGSSDYPTALPVKDQYQAGRLSLKPKIVTGSNLLKREKEICRKQRNAAKSCMDCNEKESPSPALRKRS